MGRYRRELLHFHEDIGQSWVVRQVSKAHSTEEVDWMIFDPRVYSTLALLQRQALRVGKVFSNAFPDRSEAGNVPIG